MTSAEASVAGLRPTLATLRQLLAWPRRFARASAALGIQWPRGVLLHVPPGTGKTLLLHAVAQEQGAHVFSITAGSIVGAYAGESERRLRDIFGQAVKLAQLGTPAVIFIDEIDTLCPVRSSRRQQETRIVAQLLTLMDSLRGKGSRRAGETNSQEAHVLVVAATNRLNAVDPALRRPGRFDHEIAIGVPSLPDRIDILKLHAKGLPLEPSVDMDALATRCRGYVGADLAALCREAAMAALRKQGLVGASEWEEALSRVGPSVARSSASFASQDEVPVTWKDIGGLHNVKKRLQQAVEWPLLHPDAFARLGLKPPRGVLLHGPPGCSKTTLARAAVNAARCSLFSLSMYVGEGEAILRDTFARARLAAPSAIFLDEIDAVAASRLLSALLVEMDGLELATGVLVVAATNRAQNLDAALLRPGRLDVVRPSSVVYVGPPDEEARAEVLAVHTRSMAIGEDVSIADLARQTALFTGAELAGLCREAALAALREDIAAPCVRQQHFLAALASARPNLTAAAAASYASALAPGRRRAREAHRGGVPESAG
eukprot:SM000327S12482  [mRNA]  locus=s327:102417:105765:+ [translate_table: standard]